MKRAREAHSVIVEMCEEGHLHFDLCSPNGDVFASFCLLPEMVQRLIANAVLHGPVRALH